MQPHTRYTSTREPDPSVGGPFLKGTLLFVSALLVANAYLAYATLQEVRRSAATAAMDRRTARFDLPSEILNPEPGIITQPSREEEIEQVASAVLGGQDLLDRVAANAYRLHLDGQTDEAVAILTGIAGALEGLDDDRAANAWYQIGSLRQTSDGNLEAIQFFDKAINLNSQHAEALNNRGIEFARLKRYDKAHADFAAAIEGRPNDFYAYYNRAYMEASRGNHASAITDYDVAVRLAPDNAINRKDQGVTLTELGRTQDARMAFGAALDLAQSSGNRQLADEVRGLLLALPPE